MSKKRIGVVSVFLFAALILLTLSRFGGFKLLFGPSALGGIDEKSEGGYYKLEVSKIYTIFAEGGNLSEKARARYAIAPYEGKLLVIRFPERYFNSVDEIMAETGGYLGGKDTEEKYIVIHGSLQDCRDDLLSLMNKWIDENKKTLYSLELIEDTSDMEKIRYSKMFLVDSVNGTDATFATVASVAALALITISAVLVFKKEKTKQTPENNSDIKDE